MDPSELSASLRQIIARIGASKSPSRKLVASDLKKVLRRLAFDFHECNYDGFNGLSFRNEDYGVVKPLLLKAYDEGYTCWVVDDSFMVFKPNAMPNNAKCAATYQDLLTAALDNWWVE